ncbi:MAG: TetR/AcrR family transcriptional regulator [Thermodesulfobacteriota bacterium]
MSRVIGLRDKSNRRNISSTRLSKKNNIIRIAAKLFSDKSFHDVTMDEIAEQVGVAKGTLYLYFSSKENLYLEILEHTFDSIESLLEAEVAKSDSAPEKLKKVLAIIIKFYRENIDVLKILSRDETHIIQEHHELTEKWRLRRINLYDKIIKKGITEGSFKTTNSELAALILYGSVGAVMVFYDLEKSPKVIAEEMYSEIASGLFH